MNDQELQLLACELSTISTLVGFQTKHPVWHATIAQYTKFLSKNTGMRQRVWHVQHLVQHIPTCELFGCSNNVKWHISKKRYNTFCSVSCANNNPIKKQNIKSTTKRRYGNESFARTTQYTKQRDISNIKKYGTINPNELPQIQKKRKKTLMDRYGVEVPLHSPIIQQRSADTKIQRYGTTNVSALDSTKVKAKKTNNKIFGRESNSQVHVSVDSLRRLNDYTWLHHQHITLKRTCVDIGIELGVYNTTIHRYLNTHNIPIQRWITSAPEREICSMLDDLGVEYVSNDRSVIHPKELDIYIPGAKLAIEYCGLYWHSDIHDRIDRNYHKNKLDLCNAIGIRLITIFEDEWIHRKNIVIKKIQSILGLSDDRVVYARKTTCGTVPLSDKIFFLNNNHIQGNGPGSITYGLYDGDTIVAMMTFIQHANKKYTLNRYATNCRVLGGFSKLLYYFCSNTDWSEIKTFADLRWSEGLLYEQQGFECDNIQSPDYSYIKNRHRLHKFGFRLGSLKNKLTVFDATLTERENCDNNGILRIWDCGKKRYVKKH